MLLCFPLLLVKRRKSEGSRGQEASLWTTRFLLALSTSLPLTPLSFALCNQSVPEYLRIRLFACHFMDLCVSLFPRLCGRLTGTRVVPTIVICRIRLQMNQFEQDISSNETTPETQENRHRYRALTRVGPCISLMLLTTRNAIGQIHSPLNKNFCSIEVEVQKTACRC